MPVMSLIMLPAFTVNLSASADLPLLLMQHIQLEDTRTFLLHECRSFWTLVLWLLALL